MSTPTSDSGKPELEALNALDVATDALHTLVAAMERLHGCPLDPAAPQAPVPHLTGLAQGIILVARGLLPLLPCYRRAFLRAHTAQPASSKAPAAEAIPRIRSAR